MRDSKIVRQELTIVKWVQEMDLRQVSWIYAKMKTLLWTKKLKDGQAVLFSNKAMTRFRLLAKMNGMPLILLPPSEGRGLYRNIAEWLSTSMGATSKTTTELVVVSQAAGRGRRAA